MGIKVIIKNIINSAELASEDIKSRSRLRRHCRYHPNIEEAIRLFESDGGTLGGFSLTRGSIRYFTQEVSLLGASPKIIECGGGQSTLFWRKLIGCGVPLQLTTIEHSAEYAEKIRQNTRDCEAIQLVQVPLHQITTNDVNLMYSEPNRALEILHERGQLLPEADASKPNVNNAFYALPLSALPAPESLDGLILDGPNGDGRSLAFPIFATSLKPNAIILIDDYDHFPFLQRLGQVFNFTILKKGVFSFSLKRWVLVQLSGRCMR